MSYLETLQQIKKGKITPIFFLYGSESYFIQNLKSQIIKEVLQGDDENLSIYDLEETPIQEVIADVETYPFFGEKKLIIANNPGFLKAKPDKLPFEHDLDSLQNYLESPVDYSVLVIIAEYEKIDERKKISKLLKKHATVALCHPIKEYELSKWINNLAMELNVTIAADAYEIFETELTANLQLLETELTKLALYVGENGLITKEIAEDLIAHTSNSSSLRLADAVIERNLHKAIAIYKDLEKMKEEPIALIGLLAFQFRTILRVKLLKLKGYTQSQMQKQIGGHPYVIKIALTREKRFTVEKLQDIINKLANADATMKQGGMEKGLAFELLLYDLVS
ncbi:DNA polymerase III subunit delta [Virgibacillus indicus]|uniref:DNA polymerase III subunit delta n=1 Tax=Virgibacillus indicus TaxID=2024554 RepID=A0A265ND47_9BACI|nr:DNA polymerase III subunit delta [Virgibacillus indicus]OZU89913.1 DNA polymerase III subunit delta [Virgibacillus indicus]